MEILRYDRGTHPKERKYDMKHWNERGPGCCCACASPFPAGCWAGRSRSSAGRCSPSWRAWLSPCLSGIRAGLRRASPTHQNNPAICRDPAWLRTESVGGRQGGRSVPAHHPVHHHHLPGGVLPSAQAAAYPLQHLYPGGSGSSVCGGSAIAATAPVIGADDGGDRPVHLGHLPVQCGGRLLFPTLGGCWV